MAGAFDLDDDLDDALDAQEDAPEAPASHVVSSAVYFQQAATRNAFWFHPERGAWLRAAEASDRWHGWSAPSCDPANSGAWTPWERVLDDTDAPFYRWFPEALTNAAFNEVDRHVLEGHGDRLAYIEEPDPLLAGDEPAQITRGALLARSAAAAGMLRSDFGLSVGDRVLFFLPAGIEQIVWVEACKRLGVIYCCCNPSLPPEQIADRVVVLKAKLVITTEHPDWSYAVHRALNSFMPVPDAIELASKALGSSRDDLTIRWASRVSVSVLEPPFSQSGGAAVAAPEAALLGARVLTLEAVRVAMNELQAKIPAPPRKAETRSQPALEVPKIDLQGPDDVAAVWKQHGSPVPVEANFPLFVIFTSGTTGKPKGVCHAHSYTVGLVETMRVVFNADPATDRMLTVGALGWITGQSYQIAAVLAAGITSVLMRGNPVKPTRSRFAEVIQKHNITIFKAGSAFLREVMSTPEAMQEVKASPMNSLKIATFCAEPVSEAVQAFAMDAVCKMYINSYWATEHGGMAWSRRFNSPDQPLKANARSWPLPWVDADVYVYDETAKPTEVGGTWKARVAECGERADVVCTNPYPYMFRYVWGDVENFGQKSWTGDRTTMLSKYWRKTLVSGRGEHWAYTQGDFAVKYADGAYTFHGRSDEVLNVNGILFGTEHIEGAILRDKQLNPDSRVGHCVVVGYPDEISGEVPLAFLTAGDTAKPPGNKDFVRLFRLVEETVGPLSLKFVVVSALPQTFSGKFMRRLLSAIARGQPLGDMSTISNPDCIPLVQAEFAKWKKEAEGKPS